jgi:hypothetical protein
MSTTPARLVTARIDDQITAGLAYTIVNCLEGAKVIARLSQIRHAILLASEHLATLVRADSWEAASAQSRSGLNNFSIRRRNVTGQRGRSSIHE